MRRLFVFILALCLWAGISASAEETQLLETSLFTIEVPAGLDPDLDEYWLKDFPFLKHILTPIIIQGGNDAFRLRISLYDFPREERHLIDSQQNRPQALFDLMCEYKGLTGRISRRGTRVEGDFRDFMVGSAKDKPYSMATLYNQKRGEGYMLELHVKENAMTAEEAEALLLSVASSIREPDGVYPQSTGMTLTVTHTGVNIRSAPDPDSRIIRVAKQGETFPFLGESGIWYMIDADGQIGYVSKALTAVQ